MQDDDSVFSRDSDEGGVVLLVPARGRRGVFLQRPAGRLSKR